ncbi:oligosaccharide flippase family protein [Pseudalkalibacillus berkeleyi]|uniref:Oligosaccharide flippase family protein n=1 Tax=Pseudalkalibacillus berkeleyi TaxID=1069813 RepID=A0ABS9H4V4_9BACL|nr:oligosaccharide flippase family protein [Pseudalkalibacillus berkeleyi]MCF6138818.1 oligosaccharide flippase family protein [Pseudalkalibacillus berkeleyi]
MKSKLKKLSKRPLVRNVVIVATGTAAAQVVTMAFAPVLTRLYGAEAFGVLGVFMALVGIVSPIAALTYPIAIVLPKSEGDAKGLIRISLFISVFFALFTAIVLFVFNNPIVKFLQIEVIAPFLYLIPLVMLFSAFLQIAQQWLFRTKQFRITAKVAFFNALILNSAKVGIGWFAPVVTVLVFISTIGNALHTFMLIRGTTIFLKKEVSDSLESKELKKLAKKYKDFPLYRAPQVLINAVSRSLPVLLLSVFFGPASAGFYNIGKTVLDMPIRLIGKSVTDVFYPRIAEAANNGENLTRLICKSTLLIAVVGIIPFGIVVAYGPQLFGFVFGTEWVVAGEYARWLALWLFFMFINLPSSVAIPVMNLQGRFLLFEIISMILNILGLAIGFYLFDNDVLAIALYSLTGVIAYLYLSIWVINSSRNYVKHGDGMRPVKK